MTMKPTSSETSSLPRQALGVRILTVLASIAVVTATTLVWLYTGPSAGLSGQQPLGGAAARLRLPAAHKAGGMCRHSYPVPTWSGREALVCDPSICKGADKLQLLQPPASRARRWSAFDEAAYLELFNNGRINGWLQPNQIRYVKALTEMQHQLGIFGAVGEIGVHHGKFFMPVVGYALNSEPAVAFDIFENQAANVDGSGAGNTFHLLRNLERVGITEAQVKLVAGDSMLLTAANVSRLGIPAFRMFSVDGGHSLETTLHDMMLASCVLADGGIMVLDDVLHPTWLGVSEAMFHFAFANARLKPFLMGFNKAYFTTASHAERYAQFAQQNNATFTCRTLHASRHTIAGVPICFSGPQT